MIDLSHTDALNVLRQAQGTVSLVMRRDSKDKSNLQLPLDSSEGRIVVTLTKGLRGFGFELDRELAEQQGSPVLSQFREDSTVFVIHMCVLAFNLPHSFVY